MPEFELHVTRGKIPPKDLQATIDEILAEIATGEGELADETRAVGMPVDGETRISVRSPSAGFDPATMLLLYFASAAGREVGKRFWVKVLWPEIRRRRGADAVGGDSES